jgi:hypothetical protein
MIVLKLDNAETIEISEGDKKLILQELSDRFSNNLGKLL